MGEFCSAVDRHIREERMFERHDSPLMIDGPCMVRFHFADGSEFTLQVREDISPRVLLLGIAPNLPKHPSNYSLSASGSRFSFSKYHATDIEVLETIDRSDRSNVIASSYLAKLGFVRLLLQFLREERGARVDEACRRFLNALPTEPSLLEDSACPSDFCDKLMKVLTSFELKYLFDILKWRVRARSYRDLYLGTALSQVFGELLHKKSVVMASAGEIVSCMEAFKLPFKADLAPVMFSMLTTPEISIEAKETISKYMARYCDDELANYVVEFIPMIEQLMLVMSQPVWPYFSDLLWGFDAQAKALFEMALKHPDNSFCCTVLDHFLT
jgi:hypothetical protein